MSKYLTDQDLHIKELKVGDMIEGVVVSATHKEILVDVGAKSEGIITGTELEADKSYKSIQPGEK